MSGLVYEAIGTALVRGLRAGAGDANAQPAERTISEGGGNPCRHCLDFVPQGQEMLIAAHRPFSAPQPYAETGPIFLCAEECGRHDGLARPVVFGGSPDFLLKGYGANERIVYGTGQVTPAAEIESYATALLARPDVAFVDVRSARNNCFLVRIRSAA